MQSDDFKLNTGSDIIEFSLAGVDGSTVSSSDISQPVLVLIFTCNHCPYAVAYEDRLISLANKFQPKAYFVAINSNDASKYPQDSLENMKQRAREKNFPYPYLHDQSQDIARKYGALVTPHVFVFDQDRKLRYQGGIDNNQNYDSQVEISSTPLKDAIQSLLEGKEPEIKKYPVVGCSIKWK